VLDEPTAGLHPRDTERLIGILHELTARSNTLVVVEHDPLVIAAAEYLADLGPGAGEHGGQLLYAGPAAGIADTPESVTAAYLSGARRISRTQIAGAPTGFVTIEGATQHNLKGITARLPLGRLTSVTGVSGSGKSSLVEDILYRAALKRYEGREEEPIGAHRAVKGLEAMKRVVLVDQSPIGRTPRSCPVTYMGAYAALREAFARQPAAMARRPQGWRVLVQCRRWPVRALRGRRLGVGCDVLPRRPHGAMRISRGASSPRCSTCACAASTSARRST
jgi:excinuclease ABC subunit A